jgi:hypothetical protein
MARRRVKKRLKARVVSRFKRRTKVGMARRGRVKRVYRYVSPRVRRARRRIGRIGLGKFTLKNALAGTVGLLLMQNFQPWGGDYKPIVDKVGAGAALSLVGLDNTDLVTAGIKEGIAYTVTKYLQGGGIGGTSGGSML